MSEKDTKKQSKTTEPVDAPIKNFNAYQSLENCQQFIEKQNHADRISKLRTEGLAYIRETEFLYSK